MPLEWYSHAILGPPASSAGGLSPSVAGALATDRLKQGLIGPGLLAAAVADLDELDPCAIDIALLEQRLPHVGASEDVVLVRLERLAVILHAEFDIAELAVVVAEIVEDARIGLVGRETEDGDRLAVAALMGKRTAVCIQAVVIDCAAGRVLAGLGLLVENLAFGARGRPIAATAASTPTARYTNGACQLIATSLEAYEQTSSRKARAGMVEGYSQPSCRPGLGPPESQPGTGATTESACEGRWCGCIGVRSPNPVRKEKPVGLRPSR